MIVMKVLKDRVLVSVTKSTEMRKTESGLTLPVDNGGIEEATVVEVGPGVEVVEKDDTVYIYKGAGKEFKYEDHTYRTVSPAEIIVVL